MSKININKSWKYDEALESTSHINLKDKYNLFIDGEFVKPLSKKYFKTFLLHYLIFLLKDGNQNEV